MLLSGPTFSPSTLALGADRWTASLRDSRAKTSAWRAGVRASMVSAAGSSSTSLTLQTIAVRGSSFWRTSQESLLPPPPLWTKPKAISKSARPPESWENWPSAGGTRNGSLFQRQTWAPVMGGSGGSASRGENWTTPTALERSGQGERNRALVLDVKMWMTPNVPNGGRHVPPELVASKGRMEDGTKRTVGLESQTKYWMTPICQDAKHSGHADSGPGQAMKLAYQSAQWPTPSAAVSNDRETPESWHAQAARTKEATGANNGLPLTVAAVQWPTPASRDYRGPNALSYQDLGGGTKGEQLANFVAHSSLPALQAHHGPESSKSGPTSPRRLNPLFVEHMMGWPLQWTKAEPSASSAEGTVLWRLALRQHLCSLLDEQALMPEWLDAA